MAGTRTVEVRILGDASSVKKAFGALSSEAENAGQKMERLGEKTAAFGAKLTKFATLPIAAGFGLATKAASDLGEAVNGTGLIFEGSRKKIDEFAKSAAKSIGQSERAAREATTSFGGLLQNLGFTTDAAADQSIVLTKLASDLGSAFNRKPEEAVLALASALRGETEPIRGFNVSLDAAAVKTEAVRLGLAASEAAVTKNGKAQAALSLIMQQTDKVQGDFANTAGEVANKARTAAAAAEDTAASLGDVLQPIAQKAIGVVTKLTQAFGALPDSSQNFVLIGAAALAAVGPIVTLTGNLIKVRGFLASGTTAANVLGGALKSLGVAAGVVGGVLAIKAGLDAAGLSAEKLKVNMEGVASATGEELAAAYKKVEKLGQGLSFFNAVLKESPTEAQRLVDALDAAGQATTGYQEKIDVSIAQQAKLNAAKAKDAAATDAVAEANDAAIDPTVAMAKALAKEEESAKRVKEAMDEFSKTLDIFLGLDLEEAVSAHAAAFDDLVESVAKNGRSLDLNTEKGRANAASIRDLIDSTKQHAEVMLAQGATADEVRATFETHRNELDAVLRSLGFTKAEAARYVTVLDNVPDKVFTAAVVDTTDAEASLKRVWALFDRVNPFGTSRTPTLIGPPVPPKLIGPPAPARRASGGPVGAGRSYIVGEQGPEMLTMGGQSGTITPNGTGPYFGPGSVVVNAAGSSSAYDQMVLRQLTEQAVARALHDAEWSG